MRSVIRSVLVLLHVIDKPDLVGKVRSTHPSPEELKPGVLVLVKDGTIEKWACFACPGPCGEKVMLPLSRKRDPHWEVSLDWLRRPTLSPSVHQANESRCHFWVRGGKVIWCDDPAR